MGRKLNRERLVPIVCEKIAGGLSLHAVAREAGMPSVSVWLEWCAEDAKIADLYTRARETQADHYADDLVEIADTETDPQRAKVRIDARKWVAAKLKPRKYGERIDIAVSGELKTLTDDQVTARLETLLAKRTEPKDG